MGCPWADGAVVGAHVDEQVGESVSPNPARPGQSGPRSLLAIVTWSTRLAVRAPILGSRNVRVAPLLQMDLQHAPNYFGIPKPQRDGSVLNQSQQMALPPEGDIHLRSLFLHCAPRRHLA